MIADVYVMVSDELGLMKVGWSSDSRQRNSQLRCGDNSLRIPVPDLRVLYIVRTSHPLNLERYLHGWLDRKRGSGEWFPLDLPLVEAGIDDARRYFEGSFAMLWYSPYPQPWPQADFKWGGSRIGAGRKARDGRRAVQVSCQVPAGCRSWLQAIADADGISLSAATARELEAEWRSESGYNQE